ncbi:MAG: leucyl aminopeptidase [Planctomycetaceae bacterium]|nr:leucyl aminopeptidase [Planctomycetaceae bacterium]
MQLQAVAENPSRIAADWLIVPVVETGDQSAAFRSLDEALRGRLSRLREAGDWTGKAGEALELRESIDGGPARLLLIGIGAPEKMTRSGVHRSLMTAVRRITCKQYEHIATVVPSGGGLEPAGAVEATALALVVGSTGQGLYRAEQGRFSPHRGTVVVPPGVEAATVVARGGIIGDAVNLARELVNRHPGEMYPETFAQRASQIAAQFGIDCEVLDERRIAEERMGCLLGVARGSDKPPRVIILEYRGAPATTETIGWVGKGVTFDSGGLSLKPSDSMKTMKCDMSGAAAVLSAMVAAARLQLPVNLLGAIGLVENMTGGNAYKLGEVLTARNGVTVEIMNTDAEGRLVLADVLDYAIERGASQLVDLATLTGSCVIALGEEVAGVFANNQPWCDRIVAAARTAGEEVWQMPMFDSFSEQLKSDVADCKNVGTRWGGSIVAAKFLEKFVDSKPWVHLDIAGPAFVESSKPHIEGGGTGTMVRTLVELAALDA